MSTLATTVCYWSWSQNRDLLNLEEKILSRLDDTGGENQKTVPRLYFLTLTSVYDACMASGHRIAVIYGDTLFLEGIAEILHSLPGMEVIERKPADGGCPFAETQPDVVLIDAAQISFHQMEQLIESFPTQPCPPFVRLNANEQQLTVHSTQNLPAVNIADLTQALEKICNP